MSDAPLPAQCPICRRPPGGPYKTGIDSFALSCVGSGHSVCVYGSSQDDVLKTWNRAFNKNQNGMLAR